MHKIARLFTHFIGASSILFIANCASGGGGFSSGKPGNLGPDPSPSVRAAQIKSEPRGNHYIGRRYHVNKTRFWGFVRKPGQSWNTSKLVLINEDYKRQPDRFSETGSGNKRFAFDQNHEYKLFGSYLAKKAYDPNSNQFLPVFRLTGYELINKNPGWIFSPEDYYDPNKITIRKR